MNTHNPQLAALWKQHMARPFPSGRPPSEATGVDHFDLVELDTFLAGYVSRVVEGERLRDPDLDNLRSLWSDLQARLSALSGETHEYFRLLAAVAEAALEASRPRR